MDARLLRCCFSFESRQHWQTSTQPSLQGGGGGGGALRRQGSGWPSWYRGCQRAAAATAATTVVTWLTRLEGHDDCTDGTPTGSGGGDDPPAAADEESQTEADEAEAAASTRQSRGGRQSGGHCTFMGSTVQYSVRVQSYIQDHYQKNTSVCCTVFSAFISSVGTASATAVARHGSRATGTSGSCCTEQFSTVLH